MQYKSAAPLLHTLGAWITIAVMLALTGAARAQTVPDAGTLRQQIERERELPLPGKAAPIAPAETAPLRLPDGVTVTVKAFRLAGNTLLDDARLQPALQAYIGRPLGFGELQQAAQAVAQVYREAGWIVRTYLPKQDVTEGVVTIQIIEAVFSGSRVEGTPPTRVQPAQVLAIVDAQQQPGTPLNAAALDRALLLADDLPGVEVAGALEAGAQDSETGLALQLRDEPLLSGEAVVDNGGARSTGTARTRLTAKAASPLGLGDQLRGDALHAEGSDYLRLAWSLPVGADGWRLGVNASQMRYRLVAEEFAALNGRGDSTSAGVDASYPLLRSRLRNLYLNLAYDERRFHNEASNVVQSDYAVGIATLGLSANLYDNLGGGGANAAALAWQRGSVRQRTLDPGENTAVAGRFDKLLYSASRQQVLTPTASLYGAISGQHASKDLDSSERFYLGGPSGVRAYPVNEGGGAKGQLLNLELRWRPHAAIVVTAFHDHGRVSSATAAPDQTLKGSGAAVAWKPLRNLDLKLTYARRDGGNPNPTATGKDQDGSLVRNRVWLQASLSF